MCSVSYDADSDVDVAWQTTMTGADDWYGELTEDKTHQSVTTERRPYETHQQKSIVEPAPVNDSTATLRQPADADHVVYSASSGPHMYVTFTGF